MPLKEKERLFSLYTHQHCESFFVPNPYFTGADEPYDKLKRALRAEIDEAALASLYSTQSCPFAPPETGKIAVKGDQPLWRRGAEGVCGGTGVDESMEGRRAMLAEHGSAARFSDPAGDLQHVLWQPNEIGPDRVAEIGGKARGLLLLKQAAVPVPAWCVMPAAVARLRPWRDKGLPLERLRRMLSAAEPAEWIVRSSAEGEDEARASYAGVFASQRISSLQDQIRAIEHVLDSAADNTAASYARHRGLAGSQGLSVIIQRWVEAKISGILFSAHPTRGHPRKFLLEVVTGSGSAVESGQLEPSRFEVGFEGQCILSAQPSANGPESLEAQLLEHLADYALRAEEAFGTLLDIEWVVEGDRLWVVQARPITSLRADPSLLPPFRATSWFFDQRFLEPIRPITATTLVPTVVKLAIAEPLALLGRSVPEPLYVLYCGQIYVRYSAYLGLVGDLPRWALVPELRQLFRPDRDSEPEDGEDFAGSGRWSFLARAASLLVRNWRDWLQNVRSWEGAKRELREQCAGLEPVVLESRSDWLARWNLLEERTVQVLRLHRWSVVLADYAFGVFRWLSRRLPRRISILLEDRVNLAASLPTAAANRGLREVLAGTASASEAHQFVAAYGHRSASLDFAVPTWRELLLEGQAKAHAQLSASEAAEAVPVKRRKRALLLRPLVRMLELREEQRFEWERVLAEQRRMIRSAGIELARRGILDSPDQVWFMTWNELLGALFDGIPIRSDELRLRRHEFRFNAKVRMPPFLGEQKEQVRQLGLELDGVGASRGRASGRVYLIRTPTALDARLPSGSVLVAKALDPSMTVLLQDVAAAVLERGGILSHASILAREYGVPLVTSVEGATEILATGMQVDVDGDRGVVTIDGWDHPGKDH